MEHEENDGQLGTRRFRIWVQGRLDERFSEGLGGIEQEDVAAGTMLHGEMLDRSQVYSTLDLLRSLGIDVLRFEVDPPPSLRYEAPPSPDTDRTARRGAHGS